MLFKKSLELNDRDPFTHCWYGTFLKEARGDFNGARLEYERALQKAAAIPNDRLQRHPLLLNNMALLLMDEVEMGRGSRDHLMEARALLEEAVERLEKSDSDFSWPKDSLSLCYQLIAESSEPA